MKPVLNFVLRTVSRARTFGAIACLLAGVTLVLPLYAQKEKDGDGGVQTKASGQDFPALFVEWKNILADMRVLQEKLRVAKSADRASLREEFKQKVAAAGDMAPKLTAAALAAYQEHPNADPGINDFLIKHLQSDVKYDNYEDGRSIAKTLMDGGSSDKRLANYAGQTAYCLNDFDWARKWLEKARVAGTLDDVGKGYLRSLDKKQQDWVREQELRAAETKADDLPRVKFETSQGPLVIELFENEAPVAVANFITLVEKGFYDELTFHRVIPNFMAQGGDPKGDGSGGPGYTIPCECYQDNRRAHFRGSLSMAHAGRDTGGSQFFLTFVPTSHLDGKHTVFGRVIEGMDVLPRLARTEAEGNPLPGVVPDKIVKGTVVRKRKHEYKVEKRAER